MARTRKTAQILRALKIQVATSSSSSDSDSLCEGTGPSLESLIDNEAAQDGVPYAQTLAADEDATADGLVDGSKATIYCYDSMDKRANNKLLTELAEELVTTCLAVAYQITTVHSPIQNDGDSCGLFVCLFFWRRFLKEAGNDYSSTGLLRRRWEVLKCILDYSDDSTSKAKDNS
ncbi:hypothetical protein F441_09283 [Phytophthora nicotianae CJ01A1]|uniref:Uncharacterized protein n=2 Tax=Phytophthora nicotianae TaxID=4792 RepID=W2GCY3_PHYNI|nr:hypothetical protein L915_14154 [Phytophthora nicotianae]ETL33494.1 hypothetical protein L916_14051 [Phytophthora nicotianae]ETP16073.1 hypothetical protein F441_09283 [Phytophthora nicotianae CJ01A1]